MSEEKPTEGQLKVRLLLPKSNLASPRPNLQVPVALAVLVFQLYRPIVNRQFRVRSLKWKEPPSCGKTSAHIIPSGGDCLEDKLDVI